MVQLKEKDKEFLIVLLMVFLGFLYYFFFFKAYIEKLDDLNLQKQQLSDNLDQLNLVISSYNKKKNEFESIADKISELSQKLPSNQNEMFTLLDLQRLAKEFNINVSDYSVSQKQKLSSSKSSSEFDKVFYFSSHQKWTITYEDFKRLLERQKSFYPLYSIDSITLTNAGDKIIADFEIKFYGFEDSSAPQRQLPVFNVQSGKSNLFK